MAILLPPYSPKTNMAASIPPRLSVNTSLLLISSWLAPLRKTGVRLSSNMIHDREHVMVSCTYSHTHTPSTHDYLRVDFYKYTGVLVFITQSQPCSVDTSVKFQQVRVTWKYRPYSEENLSGNCQKAREYS